jgi:glycerate-2-kinase
MRLFARPANARPAADELDSHIYVLLDNEYLIREASEIAREHGFVVATDCPREDTNIVQGCEKLFSKLLELLDTAEPDSTVCLISGGEFGCEVTGKGRGGRNSETVLRLALLASDKGGLSEFAILSCGSDGIDGNSPAAGAVADEATLALAQKLGIDPESYLEASDSFSLFEQTGGTVVTGPTGTNVRDIRILIARKG